MSVIFDLLVTDEHTILQSKAVFMLFCNYLIIIRMSDRNHEADTSWVPKPASQNFSKSGSITSLDTADFFNLNFASFFRQFSSIA